MFTVEAYNTLGEKTTRSFKHLDSAEKAFSAMMFMCFGTNMKVYLKNSDNEIIDKWDLPKGARRF